MNARVLLLSIDNKEFYELQRPIPLDDIVLLVTIVKEVCDFEHGNHVLFFAMFFRNFQPKFFYRSPMHRWIAAFTLQFLCQSPVSHGWQECAQASMMAGTIEIPSDYGVCCGKRVMHCGCVYVQALWQLLWVLSSKGPTGPVQKHVTTPPRIFSSLSFRQRISSVASRVLAEVCTLL